MLNDTNEKYWGTLLKQVSYIEMLANRLKTSELKTAWVAIPEEVTEIVFAGNRHVRRKFKDYVVARLMDRAALGPFRTGKAVLEAETLPGLEFRSGLSEEELDAYIENGKSGVVYVYRVCDAVRTSDAVAWHHSKENNTPGFLRSTRKKDGGSRFEVFAATTLASEALAATLAATTINETSGEALASEALAATINETSGEALASEALAATINETLAATLASEALAATTISETSGEALASEALAATINETLAAVTASEALAATTSGETLASGTRGVGEKRAAGGALSRLPKVPKKRRVEIDLTLSNDW